MSMNVLRTKLIEILLVLKNLNLVQVSTLCKFSRCEENILCQNLEKFIKETEDDELEEVIYMVQNSSVNEIENFCEQRQLQSTQIISLGCLFRLLLLQGMLHEHLNIDQVMKLVTELIPGEQQPDQQLQILQHLKLLLTQLLPEQLEEICEDIKINNDEKLIHLLGEYQNQYILFSSLKQLLSMELEDIQALHNAIPKLQDIQLIQLVQLRQLDPLDILEIRQLLSPNGDGWLGLQALIEEDEPQPENTLTLQIITQPPEKTVYRRNLRPNPTIMVCGDDRNMLQNGEGLYLVPVLLRCDTLTEVKGKLTGNQPIQVKVGSALKFKKLKITITSHQLNETMYCLRFELRKYRGQVNSDEYDVINNVQTNPIHVVSHSTLLKSNVATATITEVIPANGTTEGGTRVAIIGKDFVDGPQSVVKFDNIKVLPEYFGPGTLICQTPKHAPGIVLVVVSNDNGKKWSKTNAQYKYEEEEKPPINQNVSIHTDFDIDINEALTESMLNNDFDNFQSFFENNNNNNQDFDFNFIDKRGFGLIHYASVRDDLPDILNYLLHNDLFVDNQDKFGNSGLFYTIQENFSDLYHILLSHGADINLQNFEGETPLHIAVRTNNPKLVHKVIQSGSALNTENIRGETSLHLAASFNDTNSIALLRHFGAFLNCQDECGDTPLHFAVRSENIKAVQFLLKIGASASIQNIDGETPMHIAACIGNTQLIQILLSDDQSSDSLVNIGDFISGDTPLLEAIKLNHIDVVKILLENNAHASQSNYLGISPMSHAKYFNFTEILNILKGYENQFGCNHQNSIFYQEDDNCMNDDYDYNSNNNNPLFFNPSFASSNVFYVNDSITVM